MYMRKYKRTKLEVKPQNFEDKFQFKFEGLVNS